MWVGAVPAGSCTHATENVLGMALALSCNETDTINPPSLV